MTSREIRQHFIEFFRSKAHKIVPSAPLVVKNDPSLMFTNAGMNQFKDFFLGNQVPDNRRIADTQKCLRVSGKHNDLEDVGKDSYHHTMFEMLGNWSFGDYFKEEAIEWAWELLTEVYGVPKDRIYVTVFEGDAKEQLDFDQEAWDYWKRHIDEKRILKGNKKDNFWEMGDTGPCGPCSEIHVDIRDDAERNLVDGKTLVNESHPQVIEIWNLVFIQFNRKADGSLEPLPEKHVDTGMGFERLCMVLQGTKANYDTDIFTPFIKKIEAASGIKYTGSYAPDAMSDIAMRVISDHIRAVSFTIADGELPGNSGAGYVIRRILRRAVRYYYSFLNLREPLLYQLIPLLADEFSDVFPELKAQSDFVTKVILEEERSFLRTLEDGLKRFETVTVKDGIVSGQVAFELYDTFGFPIDLTMLIAGEKGYTVDEPAFKVALQEQKDRSRAAAHKEVGDWFVILDEPGVEFIGYDSLEVSDARVVKYRTVKDNKGNQFQLVLNRTPFYPEGGGQVGDKGYLYFDHERIAVLDTRKENDLIIHFVEHLPAALEAPVRGKVNIEKRVLTENNHTATHLLHAALRKVLGTHVQQKGSLLNELHLRFDFAHFSKVTDEEIAIIEDIVNENIRKNIPRDIRIVPIEEARNSGAMMLFGEKYGETVRMVTFDKDYSRELCGGCHVPATGQIGFFKITAESAIAAGVRRIEAVTSVAAQHYLNGQLQELQLIRAAFNNPQDIGKSVFALQEENRQLRKEIEKLLEAQATALQKELRHSVVRGDKFAYLVTSLPISDAKSVKTIAYNLEKEIGNIILVFGTVSGGKPQLTVIVSESVTRDCGAHAGNMVRELAKEIKGGGGGQPFFATAGGSDAAGLPVALEKAKEMIKLL